MKSSTIKQIEIEARKLLRRFEIREAPVPIEDMVENMGIKVGYAPSEKYSGMIIRKKSGQSLIGINSDEPKTRMRFTIAHELAHLIFDKKNSVAIDYRNTTHILNKPEEEKRADLFAASILVPREWLSRDVEKIPLGNFSTNNVVELAKKYKVSVDTMKYRLINLGLAQMI